MPLQLTQLVRWFLLVILHKVLPNDLNCLCVREALPADSGSDYVVKIFERVFAFREDVCKG